MRTEAPFRSRRQYKQFLLDLLPEQGNWTQEKYLMLTDFTTRLVEVTDGYIEVLPTPTTTHQEVLKRVFMLFQAFFESRGGLVLFAPLRLKVREGKFREPDLLLVKSKDDPRVQERFWLGADLVLEVVSEDKPERDLMDKRLDYAEAKVPEYWIVNPQEYRITVLRRHGKKYRIFGKSARGERARSSVAEGFTVDVDDIF